MAKKINIVEVGPRDGLQNEKIHLDVKTKLQFIKKLNAAGIKRIEVGAFVSPRWVPQMADSLDLTKKILAFSKKQDVKKRSQYSCLVPNMRGFEQALNSGVREIAVFGAASEKFSQTNINCSVEESLKRFQSVIEAANDHKIKVRGYLSTAFGCPYEGKVSSKKVLKLIDKYFEAGVYELSIGDTIGVATPKQVNTLLSGLKGSGHHKHLAMHFHDTRGTALANVLESLNHEIYTFDSSLGGLGGCPYATGASGNLATEDLVYMLEGMGYKTGVDLKKAIMLKRWLEEKVQRNLPSRVGLSGLPSKPIFKL